MPKVSLTSDAWYKSTSSCARITCTFWLMVDTLTWSILSTGARTTDRFTFLTDEVTCLILSTVRVCSTLDIDTCYQGVTLETCAAHTTWLVELIRKQLILETFNPFKTYFNNTFSSTTTWPVRVGTWIQAVFIDTSLVKRTIRICSTLWSVTLCVWITTISLRTCAHWVVCPGGTLSLWCTGVTDNTRINTSLIDTGFTLRTIWILSTLWSGCN